MVGDIIEIRTKLIRIRLDTLLKLFIIIILVVVIVSDVESRARVRVLEEQQSCLILSLSDRMFSLDDEMQQS